MSLTMRIPCICLVFTLIGLAGLNSCSHSPWPSPNPKPSAHALDLSNRTFNEVNRYRVGQKLPALKRHPGLDALALAHCQFLIKQRGDSQGSRTNVNHIGFESRAQIANERYQMRRCAENVAAILSGPKDTPKHLLLMWKTSYYHNQSMVGDWTHSGISVLVGDDGTIFATQLFASPN